MSNDGIAVNRNWAVQFLLSLSFILLSLMRTLH